MNESHDVLYHHFEITYNIRISVFRQSSESGGVDKKQIDLNFIG